MGKRVNSHFLMEIENVWFKSVILSYVRLGFDIMSDNVPHLKKMLEEMRRIFARRYQKSKRICCAKLGQVLKKNGVGKKLRPCAFTDSVGPGRWPGVAVTCRECCTSNCRTVRRFPISAVRRCAAGFLFAPSLVLTVRLSHRPLISSKEGTKQGLRSHSIIISTRQANFSRNIITESRSGTKEVVFAPPPVNAIIFYAFNGRQVVNTL